MAVYRNSETDQHFLKVMDMVRKRPGMFMENVSPANLRLFITGYGSAYFFDGSIDSQFIGFNADFYNWMIEELGDKTSPRKGWDKILLEKAGSEEGGFDLFFVCLDKFKNK